MVKIPVPHNPEYPTVSEVSRQLNAALERQFPEIRFAGEIAECMQARSGHLYLTIKDAQGQLSAVMWAGMAAALDFKVEQGLGVLCHGRPNIYKANGRFQIVLSRMLPAGEGALRRKFLELKAKLEAEGLFAEERKRKIPFLPRSIGIVTSSTGAVIHDIMVRLQERAPQIPTFLVDVKVQGEGAAKDIAEGLKFLDASGLCEVIILARGGGSLEDLWSFNEEIVVRSIFACRTPVISGVGHEVDVTLADFVADMRAPTPTAAAEMVAPRTKDLLKELDQFSRRLTDTDRWLTPLGQRVDDLELRLTHVTKTRLDALALQVEAVAGKVAAIQPREILAHLQSKLRLLEERLLGRQRKAYDTWQNMLRLCESRLENSSFRRELPRLSEKLETSYQRLERAIRTNQMRTVQIVETLAQRLEAVNPKSVLTRGYAIVEGVKGVLSSSQNIEQDDSISITFKDGKVKASVTGKESL